MTKLFRPGNPRDILATKWEIEHEDVYHFKNLYKQTHDYLADEGWVDPEGGKNWEYMYFERTKTNGKQEHHIWWRVEKKLNDYVRYVMKVDWQTLNMGKTEIMQEGQKFKTYKGDVIVRSEAWLQLDWKNQWEKTPILKHIDNFYRRRIFKPYMEKYKEELYRESYKLNDEIKRYLKLKTRDKDKKTFRSPRGIPS